MLKEIPNARQLPHEPARRWFADRTFDLIVWYSTSQQIIGFQLCYRIGTEDERALTWMAGLGFTHKKVDEGEGGGRSKKTPILIPDGYFDRERVLDCFEIECSELEKDLVNFIISKIDDYKTGRTVKIRKKRQPLV